MKKFNFVVISGILLGLTLGIAIFTPIVVEAIGDVSLENPLGTTNISEILGSIVKKLLTILGSISLLVLVAGGFLWLTSAGNAEKVKLGTNTMLYAIIGLFIIFSSYAILNTVIGGLTGEKIASQSSGTTEGGNAKNKLELANEECKKKNSEFSCVNIVNCEGVSKIGTQTAKEACTAAGDKCINGACPGTDDDTKCCKPTAPATQTTSGSSTGDSCGGAEHSSWACMDINNCDIPLGKENNLKKQRDICKASTGSCILGKCSGGDGIVCCAEAIRGSCMIGDLCQESHDSLVMNQHNCDALGGTFSFETCAQRESSQTDCGCEVKDLDNLCKKRTVENCTFDSLCQLDLMDICVGKVATQETVDEHTDDYNALAGKCRTLKKGSCEIDTDCKCTK